MNILAKNAKYSLFLLDPPTTQPPFNRILAMIKLFVSNSVKSATVALHISVVTIVSLYLDDERHHTVV